MPVEGGTRAHGLLRERHGGQEAPIGHQWQEKPCAPHHRNHGEEARSGLQQRENRTQREQEYREELPHALSSRHQEQHRQHHGGEGEHSRYAGRVVPQQQGEWLWERRRERAEQREQQVHPRQHP